MEWLCAWSLQVIFVPLSDSSASHLVVQTVVVILKTETSSAYNLYCHCEAEYRKRFQLWSIFGFSHWPAALWGKNTAYTHCWGFSHRVALILAGGCSRSLKSELFPLFNVTLLHQLQQSCLSHCQESSRMKVWFFITFFGLFFLKNRIIKNWTIHRLFANTFWHILNWKQSSDLLHHLHWFM